MSERVSTLAHQDFPEFRPLELMGEFGVRDMVGVPMCDPDGTGVLICAPTFGGDDIGPDRIARWTRLRAHVLAGLRLRRASATEPSAVLGPDQRVVHAEGAARDERALEALRRAAREIDRARGLAGRRDPKRALEAWTGLVSGEWSLVDRFDSDGRRFLVARANTPSADAAPRPLTRRERQVLAFASLGYGNKQIAYALGVAPSTVSSHLRSAMRRIGATSVADISLILPSVPEEPQ